MKKNLNFVFQYTILILLICSSFVSFGQNGDNVRHDVTLKQAHIGSLHIDTLLLNSYGSLPANIRQFYLDARLVFSENADADFTHPKILEAARKNNIPLLGGPMLGNLTENGITIWLRPSEAKSISIKVYNSVGNEVKSFSQNDIRAGVVQRIKLDGLAADTDYSYIVFAGKNKIAKGTFRTAPGYRETGLFKLSFGSCMHKIGVHNPNLVNQILKRKPDAMALLGDIAVDDRENNFNMHRADYLLRDFSPAWQRLAANVPLYATWDDHDYLNNDLNGIPEGFSETDRKMLREVWEQNWNNPANKKEGIFFNTRIGPVELIMLDTRSCRTNENRGEYGSYLGMEQLNWLKETLQQSTATYKVISSGTMWSDYISNGKDSWGTWDTLARKEIFQFIEKENISGVLLVSGDRHGARAFKIPVTTKFSLYEFEAASMGGVPGPDAMAKNTENQLFGYDGEKIVAFGEFTFDKREEKPLLIFRLIDQFGTVLEERTILYSKL
jgi:alkaline phosphatase D